MTRSGGLVASLAMYPFPSLRPATDALWAAVRGTLGWGPAELEWTVLAPEVWHHPQLLVAQTCGWPLVSQLSSSVAVVGTFDYDVPDAEHGTYRSVIVSPHALTLEELRGWSAAVAAVNAVDSLSGRVSLQHAWGGLPAVVLETGAHLESVRALVAGRADVASIDAVSWAHIARTEPDLLSGLHVIGHGPRVPCLPLVAGWRQASHVGALRAAFSAAVADPALADVRGALRIRGFVPLDLADYLPLNSLLG
ncbi:MAG: PhnD/SsuA/transferrin family substrate-binding protein [Ilumatobacteraceae bacterium]